MMLPDPKLAAEDLPVSAPRRRLLARAGAGLALMVAPKVFALGEVTGADAPAQLRIGYQKSSVNLMVVRERKLLEARLPGTPLKWVEFPAGPQLLEALSVDGIDFGFTGDTPPVFAQAAGKEILYLGLEPPKPTSSAILVPKDSSLRTLADLKGKRVGLQKGSSAHYLVLRGVEKGGLAWTDIEPVYLAPSDARAAFERGALDAWGIWDPYYAAAEVDAHARVLSNGVGLTRNNSFYLGSPALSQHPLAVRAIFAALGEADAWVHAHQTETAHFISTASGLPLASTVRFIERRTSGPVVPLAAGDIADQQRVADAFAALGLLPKPPHVADAVWHPSPPFFAAAGR